jgi:hypothetical protein
MASRTADEVGPFATLMRYIFKNILMHICLSLGLIGNIITLVVLLEKRMRRASTTQYLAALTLCDAIYLICSFANSIEIIYPNSQLNNINPFLNLFFYPISDLSGNVSIYIILMFTIERYLAVVYPLHSRNWCRPSRARKVIGLTILFCFAFTFPTFLENKIKYVWDATTNKTVPELTETNLYPNFDLYKQIYFWIIAVFFQLIPLTLLIILNSILMKYIHSSMRERLFKNSPYTNSIQMNYKKQPNEPDEQDQVIGQNITNSKKSKLFIHFNMKKAATKPIVKLRCNVVHHQQSEQNKSTLLLLATVLVFLICQLPGAILLIYAAIFPLENNDSLISKDTILGLNNIANGLVAINASINFILYSCLSEKFRQNFQRLFLFKKSRPNAPNIYTQNYSSQSKLNRLSNFQLEKVIIFLHIHLIKIN